MPRVHANGIELEYESFGADSDPVVLLVMGLGCQMVHWDDEFCARIAEQGFRVVRFDNRDIGLSTKLRDHGVPDVARLSAMKLMGLRVKAPYGLEDMADDALGLLEALSVDAAHVLGVSLGGMVAQQMALRQPDRVRSLCSWMSTTGEAYYRPTWKAAKAMMAKAPDEVPERIEHTVSVMRVIGSPPPLFDEDGVRQRASRALSRNKERAGFARQYAAVLAAKPRTKALAQLAGVPTLVLHGEHDPLVPLAAGRATARAIAGARLHTFAGVGHDMPRPIWREAIGHFVANTERAGRG